jgi:hypothetical protein
MWTTYTIQMNVGLKQTAVLYDFSLNKSCSLLEVNHVLKENDNGAFCFIN